MIEIRIDTEADLWDYDYKEEVAGDEFDELFVITGNRQYKETIEASWWKYAHDLMSDLDMDDYPGAVLRYYKPGELTREQRKALVKLYEDCRCVDDIDTMIDALNIIYPEREFVTRTIRGYCQGDWQEIVYDAKEVNEKIVEYLEAWYFGKMTELHLITKGDDCWSTVPDDDLWEWERTGTLRENLLEHFGYDKDTTEEVEIYKSDGYRQVKNWVAI